MKLLCKIILVGLYFCAVFSCSYFEQETQVADPDFTPNNRHRTFYENNSPVVFVDEAHHNFLTENGRYKPFSQVLASDGYTVKPNKKEFKLDYLKQADILVLANALDKERQDWTPPFGDALKSEEISAVKQWVLQGGSLFLIADHTPFPKVIEKLAVAFGFEFSNGHVGDAVFSKQDNSLAKNVITEGTTSSQSELGLVDEIPSFMQEDSGWASSLDGITRVKTFGGSAFKAPDEAISLLTLGKRAVSITPAIPFQVNAATPRVSLEGWSQGAVLKIGKGRVAVFAEGMMFSSQLDRKTGKKYGFTSIGAEQNERFLLNVMHWLSGII